MFIHFLIAFLTFSYLSAEKPHPKAVEMMIEKKEEFSIHISNHRYCILIDYSRHIFQKRLWVYDMDDDSVLVHCHVSHAWNSGFFYATDFSNTEGTNKSPYGAFVTGKTYTGKFGYSMRLHGLEKGINDKSYKRYITFHPLGISIWSEGCFMTSAELSRKIIDLTNDGCFMYVFRQ